MLRALRRHVSYANAMATAAVFIALGGGAYAATSLPRGSVGPDQLQRDAVSSRKVADHTLLAKDFKRGQLPAGAQGPVGPSGPAGTAGATGARGPGAISLDGQVPLATNVIIAEVSGLRVRIACSTGPASATVIVQPINADDGFYAWGTVTLDGGAPATLAVNPAAGGLSAYVAASGNAVGALDAVAEATPPGGTVHWTRIDALVIRGSACNYHALIVPSG